MERRRMMFMNGQEENEVKEWQLIYDTKETAEEITSTSDINVKGFNELMVIARVVATTTNKSARNGQLSLMSSDGNKYQVVLGNNLLYQNGNPRLSIALVKRFSDFIYVDTATSWNANDVFNNKFAADNLTSMQNSIVKYEGEIDKIRITNFNESVTYKFGIGSRIAIYGR